MPWGEDFGSPHETAIAEMFDRPVFVYNYPIGGQSLLHAAGRGAS